MEKKIEICPRCDGCGMELVIRARTATTKFYRGRHICAGCGGSGKKDENYGKYQKLQDEQIEKKERL